MMPKVKKSPHKIYIFGNPLVEEDTLAVLVGRQLQKKFPQIEFKHIDPTEEEIQEKEITIIDVAQNIEKVTIIENIDQLELGPRVSLHDFDVTFALKLLKKIGSIQKVTIIAIPISYSLEKACKEVEPYVHLTLKK